MKPSSDITLELAFPADYDVSLVGELPGRARPLHEFCRSGRVAGSGVTIEVVSTTAEWMGVIANAPGPIAGANSGVYSTPAKGTLCVVARGDAYFLNAASPEAWWALEDSPVVAVRSALEEHLLILATPWRVVAVDKGGVAWRTSRIAIDGISLKELADGQLSGVADPLDEESRDFEIELRTGYHRGGFPFPG